MEIRYMTAAEASKRWCVSLRQVQRLLKAGRIDGCKKLGNNWLIPYEAKKPFDARCKEHIAQQRAFYTQSRLCVTPLTTNLYSIPGSADAVIESLKEDVDAYGVARAGLSLLRGDIKSAREIIERAPFNDKRPDIFIAIAFIHCVCAMYEGDTKEWVFYRNKLINMECLTEWESDQRDFWLGNIDIALYATDSFPEWFRDGDFDPLPRDSYPIARYAYLKHLLLSGKNTQIALFARPLVSECRADGSLYAELYCRLIIAYCYIERGEISLAAKEIDRALELALPDRLYAPLGEWRQLLGVLLDERLCAIDKEAANAVKRLDEKVASGWAALNRELYGLVNILSLTQQERRAAQLAAKGFTNAQIANRMKITIHTVKRYISEAISKTGAKDRTELAKFIAMEPLDKQ